MKISVLIPAYNCAATIAATLDSVLCQTVPADEILVMNDGSTDETAAVLKRFEPRIKAFSQPNGGVASARNALISRAQGDLIAFLDDDDVWHPRYLEKQAKLYETYPQAAAFFTWHVNFQGYGVYDWGDSRIDAQPDAELIDPPSFLRRYNECPGPFASMSFCCIPRRVLTQLGPEPFCVRTSGADDFYLFNLLPRYGPVVYTSTPLVAYRVTSESLSADLLRIVGLSVVALGVVSQLYASSPDATLDRLLRSAYASRRRLYAKILMGVGDVPAARTQLRNSLDDSRGLLSRAKSAALLFWTYMPPRLQPVWPCRYRHDSRGWSK